MQHGRERLDGVAAVNKSDTGYTYEPTAASSVTSRSVSNRFCQPKSYKRLNHGVIAY